MSSVQVRTDASVPATSAAAAAGAPSTGVSTITLKTLMAISGFVWFGFLVGHLGSNLHVFGGPESLNTYYAGLKANAVIFWGVRVVLATSIVVHSAAAFSLTRRSVAARPVGYRRRQNIASTFASRTMRWTGPLVGVFILYHLLHFTGGQAMPAGTTFKPEDTYNNIVSSFSIGYVALAYVLSLSLLGLHLWHGAYAATLSLGARHPKYDRKLKLGLTTLAALLVLGMLSIPIAVVAGFVR